MRKDGRDFWKSGKRQREPEPSEPGEEPEIKVRRESNASTHRSLNSQTSAPESLELSLHSALQVAKEVERSEECQMSTHRQSLKLFAVEVSPGKMSFFTILTKILFV